MATETERQEFIARFCAEYNGKRVPNFKAVIGKAHYTHGLNECIDAARALMRHARTHGRLALEECNGPGDYITARMPYPQAGTEIGKWGDDLARRQERVEKRIKEICAEFNLPVTLGGDPRGYTVKIKLPSGAYNTWGGSEEGYGVPQ